jgi:hypothetical protein
MKRMLMIVAVLGLFSAAMIGCRVEGEVDPDSAVAIPTVR